MKWQGRESSQNVDDRRKGTSAKKVGAGLGIGSILIIIIGLLLGQDPAQLLSQFQGGGGGVATEAGGVQQAGTADDELAAFVGVVLKDTEDVWDKLFPEQLGRSYPHPTLVLFTDQDRSACGYASSAMGPFYCPADQKVYIDLGFYQELKNRFGASGDFAMAYVVAHEVAHHVQNLLGITGQVSQQQARLPQAAANDLSVRLELQADFLAGVWVHHAQKMKNFLEEGDLEEALTAAQAIGDDRIQMRSRGYVVPESFTHGSSEQRMRWLTLGMKTGDMRQGDTFAAREL
ncbi:MAG: zinc metallopeptidase [Chitinophagales bacterium]|nr:zinc metallopeptidase [Saprospiraceae bacterium]MCB9019475.1 zinc metallopeptidase [Chitinophagales bacterium]MCB9312622.1 zinc metallopeptidase [Lewinellaceae bacterium]HRW75095.1 neutral zinc metallopeptidase [Saprospiraceae bacterium]